PRADEDGAALARADGRHADDPLDPVRIGGLGRALGGTLVERPSPDDVGRASRRHTQDGEEEEEGQDGRVSVHKMYRLRSSSSTILASFCRTNSRSIRISP